MTNEVTTQAAWSIVESARDQFLLALGSQDAVVADTVFARESGFAVQLLSASAFTLSVARTNPQSAINAVVNVAAIGISLNPAKKQAYLVPRKASGGQMAICLDISYMGLIDLATESGAIRWVQASVVRKSDTFRLLGIDKAPLHEFDPFAGFADRGEIVGAYVTAKTADGDFLTHTMSADKIYDIRDRSQAWIAFVTKKTSTCPWATDEEEMVKKTVSKQGSKYWPRDKTNDRFAKAVHYLNEDGGEGLEVLVGNNDQEPTDPVEPAIKQPVRKSAQTAAQEPTDVAIKSTANETNSAPASDGERAHVKLKAGANIDKLLAKFGLSSLDQMTKAQFAPMRAAIKEL